MLANFALISLVFSSIYANLPGASAQSNEWTEPTQLQGFITYFGIEVTTFKDSLVIAWVPANDQIYYSFYDGDWSEPDAVPGVETEIAPAIVEYKEKLYMAWPEGDDMMWFASYTDEEGWTEPEQVPTIHTRSSPGLAVLSDKLVMAWVTTSGQIWYSMYDEVGGWSEPVDVSTTKSISAPSLAKFDDKLFLSWAAHDYTYWYSTLEVGGNWSAPTQVPEANAYSAPYLTSTGNEVILTWLIRAQQQVWYSSYNGSAWSAAQKIPFVNSDAAPSMSYYQGKLYSFWTPDDRVFYSTLPLEGCVPSQHVPLISEDGIFESQDRAVWGQIELDPRKEVKAVRGEAFNVTFTIVWMQGKGSATLIPSLTQSENLRTVLEPEVLSVNSENGIQYSDSVFTIRMIAMQSGNFSIPFMLNAGASIDPKTVTDECGNPVTVPQLIPIGEVKISVNDSSARQLDEGHRMLIEKIANRILGMFNLVHVQLNS